MNFLIPLKRIKCLRVFIRPLLLLFKFGYLYKVNFFSNEKVVEVTGPVVTLTTHGERIDTVFLTIESIGMGALKPSRLILYLDDVKRYKRLPSNLKRLKRRGLEIILTNNYGPHTKYYPYIASEVKNNPNTPPLVTADDDMIYSDDWLSTLFSAHNKFPNQINCFRAKKIKITDGKLDGYNSWTECQSTEPTFLNMALGVSGVIYPPQFLPKIMSSGDAFLGFCRNNDDIWLHVVALRNKYQVAQVNNSPVHFKIVPLSQEQGLLHQNLNNQGNNLVIKSIYEPSDIAYLLSQI